MKIDFTKLNVEVEFDKFETIDCAKFVANSIKKMTSDIGLEDVCRTIFHSKGAIEISEEYVPQFLEHVMGCDAIQAGVKRAIRDQLTPKQKSSEKK